MEFLVLLLRPKEGFFGGQVSRVYGATLGRHHGSLIKATTSTALFTMSSHANVMQKVSEGAGALFSPHGPVFSQVLRPLSLIEEMNRVFVSLSSSLPCRDLVKISLGSQSAPVMPDSSHFYSPF